MKHPFFAPKSDDSEHEILNECEAAAFLRMSTKTLRKYRQRNLVPFALIGEQVRYVRHQLLKLMEDGGTKQQKGND